jgi:membrane protease YdiL (CAAX protease family)
MIYEAARTRLAILYLVAIAVAEVVTNVLHLVVAGLICHVIILAALIVHSSIVTESLNQKLLLALCLAPLTRILSLSMPISQFPQVYCYLIIYSVLFLAAWVVKHRLKYTARETGLNTRELPVQLLVVPSGVVFAVVEYYVLRPEPLISELYWGEALLPAFILLVSTGFTEEFVFRGVVQRASMEALGKLGLPYVALLFALLHLIHMSAIDIAIAFLIGLFFGWVVHKTGSLLGVTLSHGITNIGIYLIVPFFI